MAMPHKAKNRHISPMAKELAETARALGTRHRSVDMLKDFSRAAYGRGGEEESGGRGSAGHAGAPSPAKTKTNNKGTKKNRTDHDYDDDRGGRKGPKNRGGHDPRRGR